MTLSEAKDAATIIGVFLTLLVAIWGIIVYRKNSVLERAKWLEKLYEKFYQDVRLKDVRDIIDCDTGDKVANARIADFVGKQSAEFTDYLNFFEFVAILEKNKQLKKDEVEDLFGYYLKCLYGSEEIREYIKSPVSGFEKLHALFGKMYEGKIVEP